MASVLGRAAASCSSIAEEGPLEDSPIVLAELQARRKELHLQLTDAWIETRNLAEKEQELGDSQNAGLHVSLALQYTGLASVKLLYGCFTCFFGCCARSRVPGFAGTYRGISTIIRGGPVSSPSFKRALSDEYEEGRPKLTRRLMAAGGAKPTPAQKRLAKTYVAEDKWEQAVEHETTNVWFPKMPAKQRWDLVILLLILYSCVVVPFRIGMGADAQGTMWSFEVFVTLMFLTDIFFNFNTAYPEGPNYVIDRAMIASNYLKSWFVIDALSSFPVELVDLAMEASKELARQRGEVVEDNTFAKALRALRMVRLLRMMKLLKMQELIDELEDRLGMNMQILQIVKMVVMLLYLTHLLGCGWFFIGMNAGGASSWLQSYDDGSGADAPTDVQYLYSVYWALTTLTTVGYGDITPANNAERVYALVCLLIGALVFGYILGAVGEMMSTVDKNAIALDEKLDEVKQFTRWHKMPPDLAARVRRYAEAYYARTSAMDEDSIIDGLAPALKKEVVHHLLHTTVDKIPMFMAEYVEYASLDGFQIDVRTAPDPPRARPAQTCALASNRTNMPNTCPKLLARPLTNTHTHTHTHTHYYSSLRAHRLLRQVHPLLKPVVYEKGEDVVTKGEYGDGLYILDKGTIGACGGMDPRRVLFQVSDMGAQSARTSPVRFCLRPFLFSAHTRRP